MSSPLRLVVGLRAFFPGKVGGLEIYVRELLKGWGATRRDDEIIALVNPAAAPTFESPGPWLRFETVADPHDPAAWRRAAEAHAPALYFSPMLVIDPPDVGLPVVVNIPDIQHLFYPQFFDPATLAMRQLHFPLSARRSRAVVTLSGHAARTIVERLGAPEGKVHPILLAAGDEFRAPVAAERTAAFREKHGLPEGFLFFPANFWPHKNHATLFAALAILKRRGGDCPHLALAGFSGGQLDAVRHEIERHGIADRVRILGYLDRGEIPAAYAAAGALVFPSLFEGFGIPVAEAMAAGCPVIASNATSIPEFAGDAVIGFDPTDPEALADRIERLGGDPALRAALIERGRARSAELTWGKTAAATWALFERVRAGLGAAPWSGVRNILLDERGCARRESLPEPGVTTALHFSTDPLPAEASAAEAERRLRGTGLALAIGSVAGRAPERFSIERLLGEDGLPPGALWIAPEAAAPILEKMRAAPEMPSGYEIALDAALSGMAGEAPGADEPHDTPRPLLEPRQGLRLSLAATGVLNDRWLALAAHAGAPPGRLGGVFARLKRGWLHKRMTGEWPPGWRARALGILRPAAPAAPDQDGWVGPRARWEIRRPPDGLLRLRVELAAWPLSEPQRLRFRFARRTLLATRIYRPGRYEWQWPWPAGPERVIADLRCFNWFIPAEHGISTDRRRLAVRVIRGD